MSTPLWHCSEISILLSGSAKACPSSAHQTEQQWQDEHSTEHPLLAPWKAVTWLPQHPTHPPGLWWPVGESQDHKHKAITQKDPAVKLDPPLESNLEDAAIAEGFLQRGKLVQHGPSSTCPPLWEWHYSQTPLGGKSEKITPALKGLCLDPRLSLSNLGWSQQLQGHTGAVVTLSQQDPGMQGALSQRAGYELSSKPPSEASPLLSWWCKTRDDPS